LHPARYRIGEHFPEIWSLSKAACQKASPAIHQDAGIELAECCQGGVGTNLRTSSPAAPARGVAISGKPSHNAEMKVVETLKMRSTKKRQA
jgi:hypothetical protein